MELECIIKETIAVKSALEKYFNMSKRLIKKLKKTGFVYCNNKSVPTNYILKENDELLVKFDFNESSDNILPVKMNLDILYEDDSMLVLNKPPFVPIHPSINHFLDTLSNGVKYYYDENNIKTKMHIVTRLDKDTSGIVIFAKNEYVQEALIKQMKNGSFTKIYLSLLCGMLEEKEFLVEANIKRKADSIIERCVSTNGDYAKTKFRVLQEFNDYSLVECTLFTGRTHQIRVHAKYINHPVLGDTLYGSASFLINHQALHAYKVEFIHPISKEKLEICCPLPLDMEKLIKNEKY